jgi:hypothetical protein
MLSCNPPNGKMPREDRQGIETIRCYMDEWILICLKSGCIETESKREYRRLMDEYFCGNGDTMALERDISLLGDFIAAADFRGIRGSDPRLEGKNGLCVRIWRNEAGEPRYTVEGL